MEDNNKSTKKSVYYVHGLEGSYRGFKGSYLSKFFEVKGIEMNVSFAKINKSINFPRYFFRSFFSRDFFRSFFPSFVIKKMVEECIRVQKNELSKLKNKGDLAKINKFIGSSWGGCVLLFLMDQEVIPYDSKIILLSPAPYKMIKDFKVTETMKKYKNIKIIHSKDDSLIPFNQTEKLVKELGENIQFIKIEGNDHPLASLVVDKQTNQMKYGEGSLFHHISAM